MAQLGQVGKRLQIIKIAISITDHETISIQHSKLRLYKNDKLLQNILLVLDDENYAQASNLINRYMHGPYDEDASEEKIALLEEKSLEIRKKIEIMREELIKRDREKKIILSKKYKDIEEEELINKFELFREKGREEIYNPIAKEEMKAMEREIKEIEKIEDGAYSKIPSTADIMASFNSIKDDIPIKASIIDSSNNNLNSFVSDDTIIDPLTQSSDDFFNPPKDDLILPSTVDNDEKEEEDIVFNDVKKDSTIPNEMLEEEPTIKVENIEEDKDKIDVIEEINDNSVILDDEDIKDVVIDNDKKIEILEPAIEDEHLQQFFSQDKIEEEKKKEEEEKKKRELENSNKDIKKYEPISYIDQKLRNMLNQYPQIDETPECFESEERLLYKISLEGYTDNDIEEVIKDIKQLTQEGSLAEASHLLLTIATTESLYAQFTLARELYQGQLLVRDIPEAFTQINYLSVEKYPEAICDLGQFYEHGIGIKRDKRKALALYEEAYSLGVNRAEGHYERLERETNSFLGKFFN